jgi:hypothetical protein
VGGFRDLPCLEVNALAQGKDCKLLDDPDHLNPSEVTLTLFYSRGIVIFHVMVPYPYGFFPLFFNIGMVI